MRRRRPEPTHRRNRRGFTLAELLIALVISALVAGSVAAMLMAVSYGTTSSQDLRTLVVKSTTIDARLTAAVRACRQVLGVGSDYLVLWVTDTNNDNITDNAEVQLIDRDTGSDALSSYRNTSAVGIYVDAATFRTTALASFAAEPWGTGVTAAAFLLDAAAPATKLVSYTIALKNLDVSETFIGAAAPRN